MVGTVRSNFPIEPDRRPLLKTWYASCMLEGTSIASACPGSATCRRIRYQAYPE